MKKSLFVFFALTLVLLSACGGNATGEIEETTTRGNIKIAADDAFKLITDAELFVFHTEYKYAKINPVYTSEGEALDLLKKDSVRLVIISRSLTEDEKKFFNQQKIFPRETRIAYDGLAFVTNKANPDSTLSYEQLKGLFTGKAGRWSDLDPNGAADAVKIVFDNPRSGNARYVKELFGLPELPKNCYAVQSNEEVLNYVEKNPGSIGIIGSNYISDPDDSVSQSFLSRVKILGVSSKDDPQALKGYHQPYQEYISDGSYPFKREVYIISRELGTRLGTGFAAFVAGDKGQRIVLKSGLLPAVMPLRFVNIISE